MKAPVGALIAGMLMWLSATAAGAEPADLQRKIDDLEARVKSLEAAKKDQPAQPAAKAPWTDRVTLYGDLRYRHEDIWEQTKHQRDRERVRARLGVKADVNSEVELNFRIATGEAKDVSKGADPTSNNQTLGGDESKKGLWVDLAYFRYHPDDHGLRGLEVLGGKMEVPFYRPGGNEMIWCSSLTPEGGAVKYVLDVKELPLKPFANLGGFWVEERTGTSGVTSSGADAALFGGQAGAVLKLLDGAVNLTGGASYFQYTHTMGRTVYYFTDTANNPDPKGNSTVGPATALAYRYNFNLVEAFAAVGFRVPVLEHQIPVELFGDYVRNTAAGDEDTGWLAGIAIGRLQDQPGDLALRYDYRVVEKDCVVGAFNETDSFGGGTDGRGHKVCLAVQVVRNIFVQAAYMTDKKKIAAGETEADYDRLQVDLNFKF